MGCSAKPNFGAALVKSEEFFLDSPIFRTRDFASAIGTTTDSASHQLRKHAQDGFIVRITRGVWANPKHPRFSAYGIVPYLVGDEQGYVSFLSALQRHGVISQIPAKIFVATTGHSRKLHSPLGEFDFIQVAPQFMRDGVEWFQGSVSYGIATAEKALLDCLYLSTRKGKAFAHLPEIDLPSLNRRKLLTLLESQAFSLSISSAIRDRVAKIWAHERAKANASGQAK
jgi:predicted transcriptional regulator of viral defense system